MVTSAKQENIHNEMRVTQGAGHTKEERLHGEFMQNYADLAEVHLSAHKMLLSIIIRCQNDRKVQTWLLY